MISNLKLVPYINILQSFVQNVQKPKKSLCPELDCQTSWLAFYISGLAPCSEKYMFTKKIFPK